MPDRLKNRSLLPLSVIGVYLLLAIGYALFPRLTWLVPVAVLFALASLLHRLAEGRHYWNRSVGLERDG